MRIKVLCLLLLLSTSYAYISIHEVTSSVNELMQGLGEVHRIIEKLVSIITNQDAIREIKESDFEEYAPGVMGLEGIYTSDMYRQAILRDAWANVQQAKKELRGAEQECKTPFSFSCIGKVKAGLELLAQGHAAEMAVMGHVAREFENRLEALERDCLCNAQYAWAEHAEIDRAVKDYETSGVVKEHARNVENKKDVMAYNLGIGADRQNALQEYEKLISRLESVRAVSRERHAHVIKDIEDAKARALKLVEEKGNALEVLGLEQEVKDIVFKQKQAEELRHTKCIGNSTVRLNQLKNEMLLVVRKLENTESWVGVDEVGFVLPSSNGDDTQENITRAEAFLERAGKDIDVNEEKAVLRIYAKHQDNSTAQKVQALVGRVVERLAKEYKNIFEIRAKALRVGVLDKYRAVVEAGSWYGACGRLKKARDYYLTALGKVCVEESVRTNIVYSAGGVVECNDVSEVTATVSAVDLTGLFEGRVVSVDTLVGRVDVIVGDVASKGGYAHVVECTEQTEKDRVLERKVKSSIGGVRVWVEFNTEGNNVWANGEVQRRGERVGVLVNAHIQEKIVWLKEIMVNSSSVGEIVRRIDAETKRNIVVAQRKATAGIAEEYGIDLTVVDAEIKKAQADSGNAVQYYDNALKIMDVGIGKALEKEVDKLEKEISRLEQDAMKTNVGLSDVREDVKSSRALVSQKQYTKAGQVVERAKTALEAKKQSILETEQDIKTRAERLSKVNKTNLLSQMKKACGAKKDMLTLDKDKCDELIERIGTKIVVNTLKELEHEEKKMSLIAQDSKKLVEELAAGAYAEYASLKIIVEQSQDEQAAGFLVKSKQAYENGEYTMAYGYAMQGQDIAQALPYTGFIAMDFAPAGLLVFAGVFAAYTLKKKGKKIGGRGVLKKLT